MSTNRSVNPRLAPRPIAFVVTALMLTVPAAYAQTVVRPGFNVFSVAQDTEIGKQSAVQVERQMPMLSDATAQRYVSALGARLVAQAPGPKFAYQFKVVNLSELNAFALPGGYIYVHRGLLQQVHSEGELAGVLAHEIAHVALRHPTNQASKAYLAQAGLAVLGGQLGGQSKTGQIMNAIGGVGMNTLFLKFSRSVESQADLVGSQIMSRAGYDPMEMARFFAYMGQQAGGNPGAVAKFLSDHPAPADREARVRQEAKLLGTPRRKAPIGSLATVKSRLNRLAPAPTTAQLAQGATPAGTTSPGATGLSIEAPSTRFRTFQQRDGGFTIEQPDNWSAGEAPDGYGVTILPRGGIETNSRGQESIAYGVIINHFVPLDGMVGSNFVDPQSSVYGTSTLEQATSDLVRQIRQANPHLERVNGSDRRTTVAGAPSIEVSLTGQSPRAGRDEQVTIVARALADGHIVYALLIAPSDDFAALRPTFNRMVGSLRINERVAHD